MAGVAVAVSPAVKKRRKRRPISLPAGAYHHVDFLEGNVTLDGTSLLSVAEQGSVGGSMASSLFVYRPGVGTVNDKQFGNFDDPAGDGFGGSVLHSAGAAGFPMGADNDDPFYISALFLVEAGIVRYLFNTMGATTPTNAGFFARQESNGSITVGMSPAGQSDWLGLAFLPILSDGWHVLLSKWGNGAYAHYVDNAVTPVASGSYTHNEVGGNPSTSLFYGISGSFGPPGLGGAVIYQRDPDAAERLQAMRGLRAKLELPDPLP